MKPLLKTKSLPRLPPGRTVCARWGMSAGTGLLLVLLLASSCLGVNCQLGPESFTPLSACLGRPGSTSRCIQCDTSVTVEEGGGQDCSDIEGSLDGRVCSRLEDVVESVATGQTEHGAGSCIRVLVSARDSGEPYLVQAKGGRTVSQNVVFAGEGVSLTNEP